MCDVLCACGKWSIRTYVYVYVVSISSPDHTLSRRGRSGARSRNSWTGRRRKIKYHVDSMNSIIWLSHCGCRCNAADSTFQIRVEDIASMALPESCSDSVKCKFC